MGAHIHTIPVSGGAPKQLTDGQFADGDPEFSPDGRNILYVSNRDLAEASNLWIIPAGGGQAHAAAKFGVPGVRSNPHWFDDGKQIYFHRQTSNTTGNLYTVATDAADRPQLLSSTTPVTIANTFQTPERVTWKSKDGREISGILYKPQGAKPDAKLPAVLCGTRRPRRARRIPRGRVGAVSRARRLLGARAELPWKHRLRRNVPQCQCGRLERRRGRRRCRWRGVPGRAEGRDRARLGIGGGSHGGTMVAYMVTRYPDLFAAAIELYGVVDRALFLERTNRPSAIRWSMKMGGSPSEKPETYRRADGLLSIDKVHTPLLVMHGQNDPQVPPAESARFVEALHAAHKPVFYFTYAGELHGFAQPAHRLDAWEK